MTFKVEPIAADVTESLVSLKDQTYIDKGYEICGTLKQTMRHLSSKQEFSSGKLFEEYDAYTLGAYQY